MAEVTSELLGSSPCDAIEIHIFETDFMVRVKVCSHCGKLHEYNIPIKILTDEKNTINIPCPAVKRLPRLTSFHFDFTSNMFAQELSSQPMYEGIRTRIKEHHGEIFIEEKFLRWKETSRANIWLIEEFNPFLEEITNAYIQGYYYLSITGACCLTERILNRLVVKIKNHHKNSPRYKLFYDREKQIQNWDLLIDTLADWDVLNNEQITICKDLHKHRNNSVHYIPGYDFQGTSPVVIKLTIDLIDSLFSVFGRTDIFNVFIIPGEIWVKEEKIQNAFVQEFVLPCCSMGGAISQFEDDGYLEVGAIAGDMSEEDFIEIRTDYVADPDKYKKRQTPVLCAFSYGNLDKFIRLI